MNILSKVKVLVLLVMMLGIGLVGCGDENGKKKKLKKVNEPIETYFATSLDCDYQKNIVRSQRKKLLVFDPTGIFPENLYATSPSNKIKNDILSQNEFKQTMGEMCDLFFVTQDCPEGVAITQKFRVTNYPTFMVVDKAGTVLYKKEKLTSLEDLYEDVAMLF